MEFGIELEIRSGAHKVLGDLYRSGDASDNHYHDYHCRCPNCNPERKDVSFFAQKDCTVAGEIISTIMEYGSPRHLEAVEKLSAAMLRNRATTVGDTGLHVHVSRADFTTRRQDRILHRLMSRYHTELEEIAAGPHPAVRGYNPKPHPASAIVWSGSDIPDCGGWLRKTEKPTYEFRLWNSTRVAWRINLAIGLSVAMTKAALDRADTTGPNDSRPIEAILAPYLDNVTWAGILRQRYYKGGLA